MTNPTEVADILLTLVAHDNGADLDQLYELLAQHPGATSFTAEQGRDALLVAMAHFIKQLAGFRRAIAVRDIDQAVKQMKEGTEQLGRIATLAEFLQRSGEEAQRAYYEGRPAGPLNPFNAGP
jgi:hypothetical protein